MALKSYGSYEARAAFGRLARVELVAQPARVFRMATFDFHLHHP